VNPAVATTTHQCNQAIVHNISLTVSDGDSFCNQTRLLSVTCVPDVRAGPPVMSCDDSNSAPTTVAGRPPACVTAQAPASSAPI